MEKWIKGSSFVWLKKKKNIYIYILYKFVTAIDSVQLRGKETEGMVHNNMAYSSKANINTISNQNRILIEGVLI